VTPEQAKLMSNRQIQNIIFMPGFSTADQVTNISGRGVGMDVVKSNIERIGGTVDITSNLGEGSVFKLKIPLTLAIVPALVIQDRHETFALPQISLVELVRLDSNTEHGKIEKLYDSEFFRLRGDLIPVFRLSEVLKLDTKIENRDLNDGIINVVVLNAEGRIYGLIVDEILDTEEIVVKPLSNELKKLSFFAGATIMGDGRVALILDALGFYNFADKGHGQKIEKMNNDISSTQENSNGDKQELLICELGDHRTYAIPLMLVNRLEEFKGADIEWTGDQAIVKYGNLPMPLIDLENTLNLKGQSELNKAHTSKDALIPCIVVKVRSHLFGFVVSQIRDIAITDSLINSDSVDRAGLLGTVFLNNKTITMLDVHEILSHLKISKNIFTDKAVLKKGRILLIEDSPLYQKIQRDFLEENGYEVKICSNGHMALALLKEDNNFNLIISDLEMPVMDGWTFAQELRKIGKGMSTLPLIALSSKFSTKDIEKSHASGFNEHIEKNKNNEILKTVQNYL
jgi:two-component system chemotaxis sensor kinase CheA